MNDASKESDERNRVITTLKREYETLEKSFWVTVSFLLAVVAHLMYKDWYLTAVVLVGVFFLGWRFLAKRPYSKNKSEHRDRRI